MDRKIMLDVQSVSKDLSNGMKTFPILHNISFIVQQGEWVSLVGPSGSGKTTLLGILAGIDKADKGRVVLAGQDLSTLRENELAKLRNQKLGIIFQNFYLVNTMTALENVASPLFIRQDKRNCYLLAADMLNKVGLGHRMHNRPHQLSGGEQQRVAIARALVTQPALLFADEPTGNLDSTTGEQVLDLIHTLRAQMGLTLVMVTHDERIAKRSDRQLHLYDGRLINPDSQSLVGSAAMSAVAAWRG
jgi:putative ABC transport system ATP-binding protein